MTVRCSSSIPDAEACLDGYHVIEKVWKAGECMYRAGSQELAAWVGQQAKKRRRGATRAVIDEIGRCFDAVPKTGPGNKGKRERLLHLRCILLNAQWDDFVAHLAAADAVKLRSAPVRTRTHDATAAA